MNGVGFLLVTFGIAAIVYHLYHRIGKLEAANVVVAGVLRELIDILKERNKDSQ